MTKASNLRDQSIEELQAALDDARKTLYMLRNEMSQGTKREKPHRLKFQRKEIARLLTVLHEKQTVTKNSAI